MNKIMLDIIDYALGNYEKIGAKKIKDDLYIKLYTEKDEETVLKDFEEKFKVKEIDYIYPKSKLIIDDMENGVELYIKFY